MGSELANEESNPRRSKFNDHGHSRHEEDFQFRLKNFFRFFFLFYDKKNFGVAIKKIAQVKKIAQMKKNPSPDKKM